MIKIKAIIPVAGVGTRMRPHTHTYPKALLYVGGKPILGHILDEVKKLGINDVVLILGYMGNKIKAYVEEAYPEMNFSYTNQDKPNGPGYAVYLAKQFIEPQDKVLIIYGDTIFVGDMSEGLKTSKDGSLAVKRVEDPRRFGVVEKKDDKVTDVIEKPDYVKPMDAMIGIYFFNNSKLLVEALDEMIETDRKTKGEFYLTDAIKIMIEKGGYITTFYMEGWYDCGKPETLLETNKFLLSKKSKVIKTDNSVIIEPVYLEEGAEIKNSIIGPDVSVGKDVKIESSIIKNSILNKGCVVKNAQLTDSIIGENAIVEDIIEQLNVGDNSEIKYSGG
ncbi:NTP transferase domain-containing protein [Candidatus Woesearchaeota archaeon]|nr:NTP transferase domain-containing protein [Candidatus Woesearchaeota archaeon]